MAYVDGFVIAVPTANKAKFRKQAEESAVLFKKHGALKVVECWGDDVPAGKLTSFPMAVKCQPDETVVFAWILWPSKEARNTGMEKTRTDMTALMKADPMPFDGKRMIFGGFEVIVDA